VCELSCVYEYCKSGIAAEFVGSRAEGVNQLRSEIRTPADSTINCACASVLAINK
jgi:hypothetical protein